MAADTVIIGSFLGLTNYFASKYEETKKVGSLDDLWRKHGSMIAAMMECDTKEFRTADLFYEVLHRKIGMVNGSLAEALDPRKAASGEIFEICKFYALYLEYLRKDHSVMLTNVLENLAADNKEFNSAVLLEMFAFFDKLYSEDTVDEWWTCLQRTENPEESSGFKTPTRSSFSGTAFQTPTATARRLRTAASTARRSPIAEAVDSPTMKYMRSERELKQAKRQIRDTELTNEDLENRNKELMTTNRELKLTIETLKSDVAGRRVTVEDAEHRAQEITDQLEAKEKETALLIQQLEDSRVALRTEQRHLEGLEVEKEKLTSKLETAEQDRAECMKQIRALRTSSEEEFSSYRQKEEELTEQLRAAMAQNTDLTENLNIVENVKSMLQTENTDLKRALEELSLASSRNKQDADNAKTQLVEEREQYRVSMDRIHQEREERIRMADATIVRLQKELTEEQKEKRNLQTLLDGLNEKVLNRDRMNHEQNEGYESIRACLEATKRRIELLEVDLHAKEDTIKIQSQQMERTKTIILNEKAIRQESHTQFEGKIAALQKSVQEKETEIACLKENMQNLIVKQQNELKDREIEMQIRLEANERLNLENDEWRKKNQAIQQEEYSLRERIKLLETTWTRSSTPDSLSDILQEDGVGETKEELQRIVDQTPRKSVAFNFDIGEETMKGTPIGFKPRDSICSAEFFDRASTARSSLRSESLTIASAQSLSGFKTPYTPSGTSKERIGLLASRNEKVKPHLQSSYATEMGDVNSPSADEENIRKGGTEKIKPKKRRDSILSSIFSKKN